MLSSQFVRAMIVGVSVTVPVSAPAFAASHSWRVNELFSDASGTIQFIELQECCGFSGEIFLAGLSVSSDGTGKSFVIPAHILGDTANRKSLTNSRPPTAENRENPVASCSLCGDLP